MHPQSDQIWEQFQCNKINSFIADVIGSGEGSKISNFLLI